MIRDESTKALLEAFQSLDWAAFWEDRDIGDGAIEASFDLTRFTSALLAASPTLARRLDLGTAWDDAVAALPAGWSGPVLYPNPLNAGWHAEAFQDVTSDGSLDTFGGAHANAPDPTDALVALTAALRERQP